MTGWIRSGRTFQPRLTLEHTGYSGEARRQWCLRFIARNGRTAECGLQAMDVNTAVEAWHEAADFLKRIGCKPLARDGKE